MAANILLVDDDALQAATRKTILETAGHNVKVALNGQEALSFLNSDEGYAVRIIITDHLMPVMNGPDFVRTLRKSGFMLPVLVLSGLADVDTQYDSLHVSVRVKPFPPSQLLAHVQYLLTNSDRRTA
jgi:DNA-binding response OmpR family regulator